MKMLLKELERELEKWSSFPDPFREFSLINHGLLRTLRPIRGEFPPVDISKDEEKYVVSAEIPGVGPEGVDISLKGKTLTVRFERRPEELGEGEYYTKKERWYGDFNRVIDLPCAVEADKVKARFNKGILHIELPFAESEKPKKISVQTE
ncbi:MAG: Hsp20/alpha crystallin family protein [Nitrospiraceae bacterium]|nr:MAG: Hsp20/alpha crystallin family protein [Nitrospiraceae bacterium]